MLFKNEDYFIFTLYSKKNEEEEGPPPLHSYFTGKSDRADQLGGTTTNNFAKKNFCAKSYFSIVIFNILKDENDSSKGKKVYLVSTTKLRFIRVPPK